MVFRVTLYLDSFCLILLQNVLLAACCSVNTIVFRCVMLYGLLKGYQCACEMLITFNYIAWHHISVNFSSSLQCQTFVFLVCREANVHNSVFLYAFVAYTGTTLMHPLMICIQNESML